MLKLAILTLAVGLGAALVGFTGLAGSSPAPAQFLALLFIPLSGVFLILGISPGAKHP
jgi:uncharacterized membrane protein YtjA (UPF0391 family)